MTGMETIVECKAWEDVIANPDALVAQIFEAAMSREPRLGGSAALLFADDERLRRLNNRFRGKDEPTNVLSFPSGEPAPGFLGDIALAYETCAREAAGKDVAVADHAAHLIAHGLLHLVGHDHIEDADAELMQRLEADILDAIGISDPYQTEETIE